MNALIKPGQHRALIRSLAEKRCPHCNRHGSVTASRTILGRGHVVTSVAAGCRHCARQIEALTTFVKVNGRWQATGTQLAVREMNDASLEG